MTSTAIAQLCPNKNYLSLPLELRIIIYTAVLRVSGEIVIRSPRTNIHRSDFHMQYCRKSNEHRRSICQVNKQTYTEASRVFYNINTFVIGNKTYGSYSDENLHGLKMFVRHVPKHHLACIQYIEMRSLLPEEQWSKNDETIGWDEQWAHIYDQKRRKEEEEKDCEEVARIILKNFTGVKSIKLSIQTPRRYIRLISVANSYNCQTLSGVIQLLIKLPVIRGIQLQEDEIRDCQEILDKVLEVDPEAGQIVTLSKE